MNDVIKVTKKKNVFCDLYHNRYCFVVLKNKENIILIEGGLQMKIKNSIVLVTGANRGIGKAFVEELLVAGAKKVYLGVRDPSNIAEFVKINPRKRVPLLLDVTDSEHIKNAAHNARDVTILINNAGVLHGGCLQDKMRMDQAHHEMGVNYFGTLSMIRAFAPILKANGGGAIINIASIAGLVPMQHMPTYSASKAAIHFLTMEARMELARQGTFVVGVYPGPVDTDMAKTYGQSKIKPSRVAQETICGFEEGETQIFPDPFLKNIYAVLHNHAEYVAEDNALSSVKFASQQAA